ncbi:hypothetical protein EGR_11068 [Echinococcus granulosus]|uniref:Uncharacterized protein n=1 Tax=Echinococcus granulosus TaxID=6210 RepID=W6TZB8_ECHGR|nr:hypothetical protein EGR_11068 [Echinococcus granulosus]EUB54073.1 hypothetical protein EGR_11068 [Echinococcus granulosus]
MQQPTRLTEVTSGLAEVSAAVLLIKYCNVESPLQFVYNSISTSEMAKPLTTDRAIMTADGFEPKVTTTPAPAKVVLTLAKSEVSYVPELHTTVSEGAILKPAMRAVELQATTTSESLLSSPKRPLMHSLEVQALMSPSQAETTTHVTEVPQSLIVTSIAIPHRITTSTATMTEAMIEPAKPIVLHSVPPTATATPKSEVTSSFLRPDTVFPSQALERPTEVITSEWILDHTDAEAWAPLKEMSGIVSSASEAPLPKTVLQDISVLTEPIFSGVNRGTQTIVFAEPMPLIEKEETVTVSSAPPIEATSEPTSVRFGAMETPLQSLCEGSITSVLSEPVVTSPDAQTTEDLEPKIMSTQYFSKGTTVNASAQVTHISEQQVVVTEDITSLKMKLQTVGVQAAEKPEPEKVVPTLSTVTTVGVQALALPGYVETISHIAEGSKTEVSRPVSRSIAIMTDVFIEPKRPTVVHAVPPTQPLEPSTTAISSGCSPDYANVSITAPSKEVLTTTSSVTEPLTPKVPTQVISMVTELLHLSVDASTEPMKVEEPEPLIEKEERTSVAHAAPPTETAPIVSFVKLGHSQTPPASKTSNSVCTSTMTLLEIAPQATDVAYATPPHPPAPALEKAEVTDKYMQTQPPQVAESLTMTEVSVVKSINLQTEESEFIWEEEVPTYPTMKYNAVETILMPSKHRSIQCSLIDSPAESIELTRSPEEFAYEEVEVNETYYKFTDTQVVETQTERVPLMHWAEFSPSTGFSSMQSTREFYELFRSVRASTWDRCVTEELEEYFSNVGYSMMNTDIYDETLSRGYLKEYSSAVEEVEKYMGAEVGIQFPYETIVHEPFEYETSTKSEQSVEESYTMRRRLGQIRETESIALPTTKDFGVQIKLEPETSVTESSVIEIKKTDQVFAYQQPVESKAITIDRGHQTELDSTVTTYHMQKTDTETAYSHITDVIHVVDEPMYVKTQVCISTVTEASQTEPLSYDYLRQQLEGLSKPEAKSFRHDCLHDLDIMTYFFDQDAHEEEYLQREQENYLVLPMGQPETEKLPITIRQRIVEYELCDMMTQIDARSWNDIREVASPITGLFAPVSFAIRQGWIQLGGQNEYIDPTTGHAIPLETALAQGRIRFANTASPNGNFTSSLVYIERESAVQERADATFVLNTVNREYIPIRQAQLDGLIRKDENQVTWVLNSLDNTWITAEEAISQNILKVDKIYDQESDEEVMWRQQPSVARAYHVTAIRPGGEPCEWLRPEDAVRLGLFNRQTGDVAVDWPSRPSYQPFESGKTPPPEFAVSQWCNFLTARQAGWIRLVPEMNINKWIPLSQPSGSGGNRRLLSTSISLLSSRAGRPDQDQSDLYRRDDYQRSGRPQVVVRQYSPYAPDTMHSHLGSGSHSPEYETESSRTPPYLTEVGEFEHSEVYVLSSSHHGHMEVSGEQISHQEEHSGSHRTLEVGDGQFYSYPATSYPSDGPVSTVRHEFEEIHAYEDSSRGHYSGEQSSTWSRSQHYTGQELSTRISDCSVTTALTKNSYRIANESSEEELNKAWNKVRSSALATQYHVNAAAEYHQDKLGEIKKHLTELDRLRIVSKSITPLHRAVQPPEAAKEFEGVILCDFLDELNKTYLRRGQRVKVLETGRPTVNTSTVTTDEPPPLKPYWIVQSTTQEKPIKIPSVYVGLTKDDSDSTDRALCIYEQFFDSWSDQIDEWLSTGVLHFMSFLDEVTRNKDLCFEDPDKVSHLLTELELSFPQKEGAETNDEVWNKIAMEQMRYYNSAKSRFRKEKYADDSAMEQTMQRFEQFAAEVEHLASELERVRDELSSLSTVQRLQEGLDHGLSNIASDLYDKSGGHVVLQREETSSFESLHREFEEPWHRIRRTAIEVQRIVNVNALKTRRTVGKDRESDLSNTMTPFDRVCDKCQGRLHTRHRLIKDAGMSAMPVADFFNLETQVSTLIATAGSQTLEQLSLVPITEPKIEATPMAESAIKASGYSAIYSAPPVNSRLISTGVMSSMPKLRNR